MAEVVITVAGDNQTAKLWQGVKKGAKEAFDDVKASGVKVTDRLEKAFKTLGVKSASDMDTAKSKINKAFDSIKKSGVATSDEIIRAERARASEIEKIDRENFSKRKGMLNNFKKHWLGITGAIVIAYAAISPLVNIVGTLEEGWIGVAKTTGMAGEEMAGFKKEIRELSVELKGVKIETLQTIAQGAGQLGIRGSENLKIFTETIAKIDVATNLTAEAATRDFAQIANVMHEPIQNLERMGSVVNELSNTSNALASDISNLTKRMSGAGSTIGLLTPEIMAISATLKDLGVETEVGGTAMSQVFQKMLMDTEKFAKVAGLELDTFAEKVRSEPVAALKMLLGNMSKMSKFEAAASLSELGLEGVRVGGVLLKLSGGMDKLEKHLKTANDEWKRATSLQIEYETASKSMFAEATSVSNAFKVIADELGESFLPAIKEVLTLVRLSAVGVLKLGKAIGIAAADITLGFRNINEEPTKLERLNNMIAVTTKGIAKLRSEGRFPTALLHNEEKLNKLLQERQKLLAPVAKTVSTTPESAGDEKKTTELDDTLIKALQEQEKHLKARLGAWQGYYSNLKSMQNKAASDQKRLAKEILNLEKKITDQRKGHADMMAAMNITAFGDSRTEMQKYYEEQDSLDNQLTSAMQLSGQSKVDALMKYQQASRSAAREVKEDGDVIIDLQFSTMEAMERIEDAQLAIVTAQDTLLAKKKEEKEASDAWIEALSSAMDRAQSMMADYNDQIDDLDKKMRGLGMDVKADPAIRAIDRVKSALDAIPDITTKTVYLQTAGGSLGGSSAPVTSSPLPVSSGSFKAPTFSFDSQSSSGESSTSNQTANQTNNVTMNVTTAPGESPEQLAKKLVKPLAYEFKELNLQTN